MPKNPVTDLITDQEMAFAHLILSGTMTDPEAAKAVGLNPTTAAYTKGKPRVRDFMLEHRNAVKEKLAGQEAEGLRSLNLGRDQILARLWELANIKPEETRGSMAGQIKALSMILAMEGLLPARGLSPHHAQPAPPPAKSEKQPPAASHVSDPTPPPKSAADSLFPRPNYNQLSRNNPFTDCKTTSWVHGELGYYDVNLDPASPLRLNIPPQGSGFGRGR